MPLRISVIIPVYNAACFLEAAVASVLQCDEVKEVLLVEDGGSDNSLQICEAITSREPMVKLFRHPGGINKGASASRNLGIATATEEYIAFLDADDRFLPNRFEAEHRIFAEREDADGVYGAIGVHFHDEEGRRKFEQRKLRPLTTMNEVLSPEELFHGLIGVRGDKGYFSLDAFTVKRSSLLNAGQLFNIDLRVHQDTEFLFCLSFYLRLYAVNTKTPIAERGVHAGNRIGQTRMNDVNALRLYTSLLTWAARADVDRTARMRFIEKWLIARANCAESAREKLAVIGRVIWRPMLWPRHELRMCTLELLAKRDTWLGDKLNKLGWTVYGRKKG